MRFFNNHFILIGGKKKKKKKSATKINSIKKKALESLPLCYKDLVFHDLSYNIL